MTKFTHYTSEFKREAVKLAQSSDKPTSKIIVAFSGEKPKSLLCFIHHTPIIPQILYDVAITVSGHFYPSFNAIFSLAN